MRALALAAVLVSLALPRSAAAWCRMTSSDADPTTAMPCVLADPPSSFPLAWHRRCTSISLSSALSFDDVEGAAVTSAMLRSVLERSISTWTSVGCGTGLSVDVIAEENVCTAPVHYRGGRNVHSVTVVSEGWASTRGHDIRALAVTYVWHDPATGEILDADIELNEENKDFHVCTLPSCAELHPDPITGLPRGPDSADADLENTLTHELGHYFGLAHTPDDVLATMFSEANGGETIKRDLQPDDEMGICAIYPAGSLPATCDPTPAGGLGLDCTAPPSCGCRAPGTGRASAGAGFVLLAAALAVALRRR